MEETKKKKLYAVLKIDTGGVLEQIEKVWKAQHILSEELSKLVDVIRTFEVEEIKDSEESLK